MSNHDETCEHGRGYSQFCSDCQPRYQAVESHEVDALREQIEVLNLQLAACMTAALANTYASTQERLAPSHPYYSGSYRAVCEAVDREMLHRAECETLRHQWAAARAALLQEQAYADKLDRMLRSVRGFKE